MVRNGTATTSDVPVRFVDNEELRRSTRVRALLRDAEEMLRPDVDEEAIDESVLFRALNACGKKLSRKRRSKNRQTEKERERLRTLQRRIIELLIQRNVGLVYDMLKRTRVAGIDRDELVSEGMWTLFKAVTSFDPWRGYRFSTYACTSILRAFVSLARKQRRDQHARNVLRERLEPMHTDYERQSDLDMQVAADRLGRVLENNKAQLTDLERFVIERRVLHDPGVKADTLSQVGAMVDLSKERVRQVQLAALAKLEKALTEDLDADEKADEGPHADDEEIGSILTPPRRRGQEDATAAA